MDTILLQFEIFADFLIFLISFGGNNVPGSFLEGQTCVQCIRERENENKQRFGVALGFLLVNLIFCRRLHCIGLFTLPNGPQSCEYLFSAVPNSFSNRELFGYNERHL